MRGGRALSITFTPSIVVGDLAYNFIKTYHIIYGRDPSDAKIKDHSAHEVHLKGFSWLNPFKIL